MKLTSLIESISDSPSIRRPGENTTAVFDPEISSIHYRSGEVKPGGLFVAMKGQNADGHHFIKDALSRGASALIVEYPPSEIAHVPVVIVKNARKALASVSSAFYGNPSNALFMMGITGTNGKTTIVYLIERILQNSGKSVGVISTVNFRYQGKIYPNPLTTPESLDLQKILAEMAASGVTHVVMEVSSHALALNRISHCWFDIGGFTNLTQDHLDFHGDMETYWSFKKMFFTDYLASGPKSRKAVAVINTNDPKGMELFHTLNSVTKIPVGNNETSIIRPGKVKFDQTGITGILRSPAGEIAIDSRLVGRFNLENILCAAGVAVAMGIEPDEIARGIQSFTQVPGRLEKISNSSGRHVFVDYAHTPDALENVLTTLKEILSGRLICVFGCGGDRDRTKRPKMGGIAARLCDLAIITSDNPRTEDPGSIIGDIRKGINMPGLRQYLPDEVNAGFEEKGFAVEPDREKAIFLGIKASQKGDTVLIAGKGHEPYQLVGKQVFPFDDREKAAKALIKN